MRTLALKRHNDWKKALRKKNICEKAYGWKYYDNLHQYSKNKIHCSCPMCSSKTNDKLNKSQGQVNRWHSSRLAYTHQRYGKKNYKISDMKKIDGLNYKMKEYINGYLGEEGKTLVFNV